MLTSNRMSLVYNTQFFGEHTLMRKEQVVITNIKGRVKESGIFGLKPSTCKGKSSLKVQLIQFSHFGEQINKQAD